MRRAVSVACLMALVFVIASGCYYFDENYESKTRHRSRESAMWQNEDQVVAFPQKRFEKEDPPEDAYEAEDEVVEVTEGEAFPAEAPPLEPTPGTIGRYAVQLSLSGITPAMKDGVLARLRGLSSVEGADIVSFSKGKLEIGLRLQGTMEDLIKDIEGMRGLSIDFLGTTTLIYGRVGGTGTLETKIFGPRNGIRISQNKVWVGVLVKGGTPASVTVNGVEAVKMEGKGRYKALVPCKNGVNDIVAVVRDSSGGVTQDRIRVVSTGGPPPPPPGGKTVLVQGKIDDPHGSVTVDGKAVDVDSRGNYSVKVTVREGLKFLTVVEMDSLGNRTIRKIAVE